MCFFSSLLFKVFLSPKKYLELVHGILLAVEEVCPFSYKVSQIQIYIFFLTFYYEIRYNTVELGLKELHLHWNMQCWVVLVTCNSHCYCPSSSGVVLLLIILVIVCCIRMRRKKTMQVKGMKGLVVSGQIICRSTVDYVYTSMLADNEKKKGMRSFTGSTGGTAGVTADPTVTHALKQYCLQCSVSTQWLR